MRIILVILSITIFLLKVNPALAVTVTISNIPTTITDQLFNFDVSISEAGAGTNYLRVDLYKDGSANYFGETYNSNTWYSGSDGKQYLPITILSGQTWNGSIQGRVGSPSLTDYSGSGNYKLKIRRYTSSGTAASSDTQTPQDIVVNLSSPSPSPSSSTSLTSSFTISNVPTQINSDESFIANINLSLPTNPNTKFYLKGAFKKPDTSNYFGLTKVSSSWMGNSNSYTDQLSITTDSAGNWSGNLEVKPDPFDSGYNGSGTYFFKVGRYSESGSGPTWSNEVSLNINAKSISVSDNNLDFSKITAASVSSSNSKSKISEEDLPEEIYSLERYRRTASVAGTATATPIVSSDVQKQNNFSPLVFLGGGLILGAFSYIIYTIIKHRKIKNDSL